MLNNIKIGSRLIFGFIILLIITVILTGLGIYNTKTNENSYLYLLDFPAKRQPAALEIDIAILLMRRNLLFIGNMAAAPSVNQAQYEELYRTSLENVNKQLENYMSFVNNDPKFTTEDKNLRATEIQRLKELVTAYDRDIGVKLIEAANQQEFDVIAELLNNGSSMANEMESITNSLISQAEGRITSDSLATVQTANSVMTVIIIIAALAFVLAVFVAIIITSSITKPVTSLADMLNEVAAGNLDIDTRSNARDEIGVLTRSTGQVVDTIKMLMSEMNRVSHGFAAGDIEAQIDASKFRGVYLKVAKEYNDLISTIISEVLMFIECLTALGNGDFNADIPKLPDKKAVMNISRDNLSGKLTDMSNDIVGLVRDATNGELNRRLDNKKYGGHWNQIVDTLNNLMDAVSMPISATTVALDAMAHGDMHAFMTHSYKGEFNKIKESVNFTMTTVGTYINEISDVLEAVARRSDLDHEITREYLGDFSAIKNAINMILRSFSSVISNFSSAAEQVSAGARTMSESSMNLATGAAEQASVVEELNASVSVLNEKMTHNANNAAEASRLAAGSRENAVRGNNEMGRMLVSMTEIKNASDAISKINKTISDIAFQTNLLALNASVEAARAGEHGKGFGVVAAEVGNLAHQCSSAAQETTQLIQESLTRVEEGQGIAKATANTLGIITEDFSKVSRLIADIAESANEQALSLNQISVGIQQVSDVVQNNSSASEESASTAQELSSQSDMLKNMVSVFTVSRRN
jgi:methyl-accepting chemotaxis protein